MVDREYRPSSWTRRQPVQGLDDRTYFIVALGFGLVVPIGMVLFVIWSIIR